ncbi:for [Symbiodinium natans]|uniref:cGMP-dependent protein kinase n=1 Tax=Symbiodinium natans TaxID=878477 RepID=A0A812QVP4_9DINO|nr:for [Symbiodinium natans]
MARASKGVSKAKRMPDNSSLVLVEDYVQNEGQAVGLVKDSQTQSAPNIRGKHDTTPAPGQYVWKDDVHLRKKPVWSMMSPDRKNLDLMLGTWTPASRSLQPRAPDPGEYGAVDTCGRNGVFTSPKWSQARSSARPCLAQDPPEVIEIELGPCEFFFPSVSGDIQSALRSKLPSSFGGENPMHALLARDFVFCWRDLCSVKCPVVRRAVPWTGTTSGHGLQSPTRIYALDRAQRGAMGCSNSAPIEPEPPEEAVSETKSRNADKKAAQLENKEYHARMKFLSEVPLMKRLPKDEHPIVAEACEVCTFEPGHRIIQQGDIGDAFYVVRTGEASVHVENEDGKKQVAILKGGDYFGENALLRDEPRLATIVAESKLVALRITREKFEELGLNNKLMFANRKAVGGGLLTQTKSKPPTEKTGEDVDLITRALHENENLATMTALDDARLKSFIDVMWKEEVKAGEQIITEGDLKADFFYIVASGEFDVKIAETDAEGNPKAVMESNASKSVTHVTPGGSFGELALMYFVPRAATVVATTDSEVWVIDRANFKNILMKASDSRIKEYVKYLDQVSVLDSLLAEEKKQVANALVEMHFEKRDVIIQQGEPGNMFYIMYEGEVEIIKDGEAVATLEAKIKSGTVQFFGEKALLENENRTATVVVKSSSAKCLVLDRESFDLLLGPLKDIIDAVREGRERPQHTTANPAAASGSLAQNRQRIRRSELKRIGLLGCGGFGAVELWEHTKTGDTYALKAISKGYIVKTGMQESIMNEKNILAMTNSSFITKLYETFNGTQTLYFLLEPCLGGELYATYIRKGLYGSDRHCKFYAGSVVFAFEHMHQRRIIYRDLKPENLLLADDGFLKLTDMGLAKFVVGKTYTTCGTPDYFAPELIASTGHTNAVDWWTLGILIFELMSGHPPFESAYPMQIYAKVTKGIGKVAFPGVMKGHCKNLVENLLKHDPSDRLAMRKGGVANIKSHPWFEDMNWDQLEKMECPAPYKPAVRSRKDLSNFVAKKEDAPKTLEYIDPGTGWDKDFATSY